MTVVLGIRLEVCVRDTMRRSVVVLRRTTFFSGKKTKKKTNEQNVDNYVVDVSRLRLYRLDVRASGNSPRRCAQRGIKTKYLGVQNDYYFIFYFLSLFIGQTAPVGRERHVVFGTSTALFNEFLTVLLISYLF